MRKSVFSSGIAFLGFFVCLTGTLLLFEQPRSYLQMLQLQRKVDEQVPDGISQDEVANWCASNGFGVPEGGRIEAPFGKNSIMTAFATNPISSQTTLAVDFYFDKSNRLYRRVAFRSLR